MAIASAFEEVDLAEAAVAGRTTLADVNGLIAAAGFFSASGFVSAGFPLGS
jgi:hypothetical protein